MTDVNIPLLRKALEFAEAAAARQVPFEGADDPDYIELDPRTDSSNETWYQGTWASPKVQYVDEVQDATLEHCGTAYCIAGFIASQQPGYAIETEAVPNLVAPENGKYLVRLNETIDGKSFHHSTVAREALGISKYSAELLFSGGNDINDVRRIAEYIAGERL